MPAFFLVVKVLGVPIPLPWFLLWLLLLPLVPLAILISPFFGGSHHGNLLRNAHLAWWILVSLHGLKVDVNSRDGHGVYLSFV